MTRRIRFLALSPFSTPARVALSLTLAAALLLSWNLLAQPPAGGPGGPPGVHHGPGFAARGPQAGGPFGNLRFVATFLDLTEEQQQQGRALRQRLREDSAALREEVRGLRRQLRAELEEETPDATRVGELMIATHGQRKQLRALREQALADFEALLTAEQLEKFQDLRQALQERRQARREARRERWQGRR